MREAMDKAALKSLYDRVAGRYDCQHYFLTAGADQRGRRLLVNRAVSLGESILDCGAGTGSTALLALAKTGPFGKAVLFDMSEGMLAIAKKRLAQAGAGGQVEFMIGDMTALPFANDSFDTVLATYSVCSLTDPAHGARELYRVTRPGGRIGVVHSTTPEGPVMQWLVEMVESLVWRIPAVSLGCRPVSVLPVFEQAGCRVVFKKRLGVPLWPFLVLVVEKPEI